MSASNIVLVITANRFPVGDAGAVRLQSFAFILRELGYTPVVIGLGESTNFEEKTYEGIRYYSLRYENPQMLFRILGRILYSKHLKKVVRRFDSKIKGILIDSGDPATLAFVKNFAKKNGAELMYDSVEWYSESEFKNGSRDVAYRYNNDLNTKIIDGDYKVIAISSYLERHFRGRDITTVRIPVMMDVKRMPVSIKHREQNAPLKIVYAGSIGGKDYIREMIDGIASLTEQERKQISFCVIGITEEQYSCRFGAVKAEAASSVSFMGRISRDEVLQHLSEADFSFLLRPAEERYAKAGFPTKVVEGLASGLPMLCNYSSDLELYLKDGENAVIIEQCSAQACAEALRRALKLSSEELYQLSCNARKTAEDHFDWRLYTKEIAGLLQ